MKFDYQEALKRQNTSESDIFELREKIKEYSHVPSRLSNKKVIKLKFCKNLAISELSIKAYSMD
jgi:hypothetical protein